MSNITLPRAVVEQVRGALKSVHGAVTETDWEYDFHGEIAALDAALAEPQPEPEPVAWMYVNLEGECEQIEYGAPSIDDDSITLLYTAPPAAATREPATMQQIVATHRTTYGAPWLDQFNRAWKAAEWFHGIGGSKT